MKPFFKKKVQFQIITIIILVLPNASRLAFGGEDEDMNSCQNICSNYRASSDSSSDSQLESQCEALEKSKKGKRIETILVAIDGAAAASCTAACGLSLGLAAASPTAAFAVAACDRIGTADGAADLIGQIAQEGHISTENAINAIIMLSGMSSIASSGKK